METEVLKVEKRIKADPARLFRAWITVKDFSRWFLPGTPVSIGEVMLDARPGGRFRIEMIVDGILRPHEGEYKIVDEPNKLVFTWRSFMTDGRDSLVTVDFMAQNGETLITLSHEKLPNDTAKIDAHREGWSSILNGLNTLIETTKAAELRGQMTNRISVEIEDFTMALRTGKSPGEVFEAITNVRGWWSANISGSSKNQGDEFKFQYEDLHYSTQKLVEVIPNRKVVWLVTDSQLTFLKKNQSAWTNTRVCFEISEKEKETEIRFTHFGLLPEVECFAACTEGWDHYLKNSLLPLINTGIGKPD